MRHRLEARREHDVLSFDHDGIPYTAGYSRFAHGGVSELFMNAGKVGTSLDAMTRDASILLSLLLQHGVKMEDIRPAMTRNGDGRASGPVGAFLDLMADGGG
ncbi:hypothetical protein ACLBXM_17890 [Xanthobacteraceae bacterium A53D]